MHQIEKIMNIKDLLEGEQRIISHFTDELIGGKLMTMGLKPGCIVEVIRKTNRNRTYYLKSNSNRLAIRENEAATIELK